MSTKLLKVLAQSLGSGGIDIYILDNNRKLLIYPDKSDFLFSTSVYEKYQTVLNTGTAITVVENLKNGRALQITYSLLKLPSGFRGVIMAVVDISDTIQNLEREMMNSALRDPLTQLPNRQLLNTRLQETKAYSDRHETPFTLFMIDLDFFKEVNDEYGHPVGDKLLQLVARRMQSVIRKTDFVARLGGDEFALVQPNIKHPDDSGLLAEKLIYALSAPYDVEGRILEIGASVGMAVYPDNADNLDDLIKNSDLALYRSKAAGKKIYSFYEPQMHVEVSRKLEIGREIKRALVEGEFYLNYQPIVDLLDHGSNLMAEVLIRWDHPKLGTISPSEFIPLAEERQQIIPITYYVIQHLCEHIKEMGLTAENVIFSLNIPGAILKEDFPARLCMIMQTYSLSPQQFKLEITEYTALSDAEQVNDAMGRLSAEGFDFAIDDFGKGYSNLSYLHQYNFRKVKIDKDFIDRIFLGGEDIVRKIISIGKNLGMEVIAEGVETNAQATFLLENGCDAAQGYYFARPMAFGDFKEYLDQKIGS